MLKRLSLPVLVSLVFAGCGVIGGEGEAQEINRNEKVPVELSIRLRGDIDLTFDQKVNSKFIVRRNDDKERQKFQVLGVEPVEPVRTGSTLFIPGIAIVPFQGDGEYTIEAGSPFDTAGDSGQAASSVTSSIKIDWWPTGDLNSEPERYMRRVKPCTVEVDETGSQGVLKCPDVTTEARDKHFSFEFRWKAPKTAAPATTTTFPGATVPSAPPTTG